MLACSHFQKFGMRTYISMSDGHPWNGWVTVYDEAGALYYSSFETGLFWTFLEHLIQSPECIKEVGVAKEEIEESLTAIQTEWERSQGLDAKNFEYSANMQFPVYPAPQVPGHREIEDGAQIFGTCERLIAYDIARRIGGKVTVTLYNNTVFLLVRAADKCILISQIDRRSLLSQVKKLSV